MTQPNPAPLISLFHTAIDRTESIIRGLEQGTLPTNNAVYQWRVLMYQIGLGANPDDTPPTSGGSGTADIEPLLAELQSNIGNMMNSLYGNLYQVMQQSVTVQSQQLNGLVNSVNTNLTNATNQIIAYNNVNTQTILNALSSVGGNSQQIVEALTGNIQQLFQNQASRLEQIETQNRNAILANINSGNSQVINAVQSIGLDILQNLPSNNGGGTTNVEFDTQGIINVIELFRQSFINKDMSPTIENNIDVSGGTDSSANPDIGQAILDIPQLRGLASLFDLLNPVVEGEISGIENRIASLLNIFQKALTNGYNTYDDFIADFDTVGGTGDITDVILKLLIVIPTVISGIINASAPFVNNIETLARTKALDGLLPPDVIRELWIRQIIEFPQAYELFSKLGYSDEQSFRFFQTATIQLPDQYIREAFLRGIIDETLHDDLMLKLGYREGDLDVIRKTYFRIPPIPDLIRFAVREAYDENQAQRLQLDSGYDVIKERFERDLKQNGLEPEYGQLYWRSHWDLPSPTQGYEMLHRGVINEDELQNLLKVSDYSPQWIQKLMAISYAPYTRVDIRRMHKLGLLDYDAVIKAYKDIGYDNEHAKNLADFTVKLNEDVDTEANKDLSQSNILKAYQYNLLVKDTARTMLIQLGYNDREANILLDMADLGVSVEQRIDVLADNKRRIITSVSRGFIEGFINEGTAKNYLQTVGYLPDEIEIELNTLRGERNLLIQSERVKGIMTRYIEFRQDEAQTRSDLAREGYSAYEENENIRLWNTQRDLRFKEPTKSELSKWVKAGHITEDEYRNYLRGLGYDDKLVNLYTQDIEDAMNES